MKGRCLKEDVLIRVYATSSKKIKSEGILVGLQKLGLLAGDNIFDMSVFMDDSKPSKLYLSLLHLE